MLRLLQNLDSESLEERSGSRIIKIRGKDNVKRMLDAMKKARSGSSFLVYCTRIIMQKHSPNRTPEFASADARPLESDFT